MIEIENAVIENLLIQGEIDGVQICKQNKESFIKTYKNGEIVDKFENISSTDPKIINCREWCQGVLEREDIEIFFNKKLEHYKCVCFKRGEKKYCYLSKGISPNINFCELFSMETENRKNISLVNKKILYGMTINL